MSAATIERAGDAQRLLHVIDVMLAELRGSTAPPATLEANLERDLGIDSLARVELIIRIESTFGVHLPDEYALTAETAQELLQAIAAGLPQSAGVEEQPILAPVFDTAEGPSEPRQCATLIEVLDWHAANHPDRGHLTLIDAAPTVETLSYAALASEARGVAGSLRALGLAPGETVAIMLPTCRSFFTVFMGALCAGVVPVPLYPPFRPSQVEEHLRRQLRIMENCRAAVLVTDARTSTVAHLLRASAGQLRHAVTAEALCAKGQLPSCAKVNKEQTALLQYTSGSTGHPKGVVLSHANLLANIRAMGKAVAITQHDVFVSWLPLYHDMGLIGAWLGTLYYGVPLYIMPPQSFIARPSRWLKAMHRYRGTLSAGPNFAYEILASKVRDEDLAGLDLRAWRVAFNGAEPVRASTIERFSKRFAKYGFDTRAMMPVYGLAESAVGLTFPALDSVPHVERIDTKVLARDGRAAPIAPEMPGMRVVSCGAPLPGYEVRVVDATDREVQERVEGHVQFRGPSATSGYFANEAASQALFHGPWLDTGDVGYIAGGELFLTSREKDLIIRGGHNIHPYDLEEAIADLDGIRRGGVAVFGAIDRASGTDRVVVLAETRSADAAQQQRLRARIAELAIAHIGIPADDIIVTPSRVVPKTSSGKIRRAACRELYERGALSGTPRPVWLQFARLAASGVVAYGRSAMRAVLRISYAGYLWTVFLAVGAVGTALCLLLRGLHRRRRCAQRLARGLVSLAGIPVTVDGEEHLAPTTRAIYVANHASYIDAIVLTAVLPADIAFTAKREFLVQPFIRLMFARLGVRYVARFEAEQGIDDVDALVAAARQGESLVFFPEGGFSRMPGLAPFHMGAFVVATRTRIPVVPVVIRGTRSVLRADSWFPRRHAVKVHMEPPQGAEATDWQAAIALRNVTRRVMLERCGEPDLTN